MPFCSRPQRGPSRLQDQRLASLLQHGNLHEACSVCQRLQFLFLLTWIFCDLVPHPAPDHQHLHLLVNILVTCPAGRGWSPHSFSQRTLPSPCSFPACSHPNLQLLVVVWILTCSLFVPPQQLLLQLICTSLFWHVGMLLALALALLWPVFPLLRYVGAQQALQPLVVV